ncbi:CRISPR-associated protein Cas9/Csn1, subtype II [Psychroflexus torquis ATCC 700755]|uniref:CRISPR-associated endonuclease Cas9 n=1 Tax=Psychroflexus torquis (strain ATCC 700755 / CIP 106069 / ACAM 623) TaxID=313595 RepID=K4I9M9_PSYTT|nr:type II CRISPR RNA-guided endonuclease Cas9 [Psychroflexus torquis]AFU67332.1 CRISPR-associated protein Cas9/Csn1, subtype II [Psychroflexus torquis ATCC 700755]
MKRILGLDLGTNSIGWSLIEHDFKNKQGQIEGLGVRIIPMSQEILGKFDAGQSISQTADRTKYRGVRRLYQRDNLRRERLHRVLKILDFLPKHYSESIDFQDKVGQFKPKQEVKLNYRKNEKNKHEFVFMNSFIEMVSEFKNAQPELFYNKGNGEETKIPYDWTLYYLRKKALTQQITKEELAWLILNFNQKRGYYQLRGEDIDEDKNKKYMQLKVNNLIDSGAKVKGKVLYNVIFDNGWKYEKQIVNKDEWEGRTKEFIITTKTLKNGNIKRTYKAVDSEIDWAAIKAKTEQDINKANKTVGEYIYESLLDNPSQKIRGKLVKTIERKFYKEEFEKLLSKQIELQPELFNESLYKACIKELYPRNENHQSNNKKQGFEYLFTEDIIFYQRPLKSQKSNISGCQFEHKIYKQKNKKTGKLELIKEPIKTISRSHPLFQEFRIWQWLQNLKIYNKEKIENGKLEDVTTQLLPNNEAYVTLFDFLNTKKELEQKQFIEYFVKKKLIDKKEKEHFRWNFVEDKKYPFSETRAQFLSRLAKVKGIKNTEDFLNKNTQVGSKENSPFIKRIEQLWHIIYSVSDLKEYEKALEKFAEKHNLEKDSFLKNFKKFPPFVSDYASYSKKAISKLLPIMRMGKYWSESAVPTQVKERSLSIMERVKVLPLKEGYSDKDLADLLSRVSDDDIPKQLIKSFISFKDKNPLKGLNTYQANYLVYGRHSETGDIQHWKTPEDIDRYLNNFKQHSLRNPIVEQVVMETLRVVRDIWEHYGNNEKDFFKEIHVELGREMKSPAGKREKLSQRNTENENTNHRIREVLKELMNDASVEGGVRDYSPSQQEILKLYEEGIYQNPNTNYLKVDEDEILKIRKKNNPTQKEIQRYKLWLEQGYISPYTGKIIPLTKLFTHEYQIEHIIPQSRYYDNSLGNKIICESEVNEDKDNKTAYEYLKVEKGSIVFGHKLLNLDEYEAHVNKYFKKNKTKLKNLLSEDIPEGFINRQLNDSRYISKLVKGLLSNIVRENGEQEATSKNLIPVTGVVTSKLKQDWGLNDKWNEIIAPRFKRLNKLTNSNDFGFWDNDINAFRIQVPDSLIKGFSKKRIDHRHHALDALVVACTSRNHTHYLSALNAENKNYSLRDKLVIKNENGDYTKTFQIPWQGFTIEAKNNLEKTVVSFKKNLRVINKTNNKFWSYKDENGNLNLGKDGKPKKKLRKQTKGYNWAIRKPLHKETVSGIYNINAPKNKIATSVRTLLTEIKNEKHLAKITDLRIRETILPNHLKHYLNNKGEANFSEAFSQGGIEDLNKKITTLNEGKKHQPIYRVKIFEVGSKFSISEDENSAKSKKYVEAAKGTNLFFAIYLDEENKKRNYETIPLNEVITHQKQVAGFPKSERLSVQPDSQKGTFLFTLSPNDLVYVPNNEELENRDLFNLGNLNVEQISRIYKFTDSSDKTCNFIPFQVSKLIFNLKKKEQKKLDVDFIIQNEFGLGSPQSKNQKSIDDVMIKEKCIKLKIDRLGNISKA